MNPLSIILDFLSARILVIFAIAGGALLFLLLPDMALEKMKIKDYGDLWRASVLFVDLILWVYLVSKFTIFLFDCIKKFRASHIKKRVALKYFQSETSLKMGEIAILVDQKKKNEHQFITAENNEYIDLLCGKGLLVMVRWIDDVGGEYAIPDFVWKSKRLMDLNRKISHEVIKTLRRVGG